MNLKGASNEISQTLRCGRAALGCGGAGGVFLPVWFLEGASHGKGKEEAEA